MMMMMMLVSYEEKDADLAVEACTQSEPTNWVHRERELLDVKCVPFARGLDVGWCVWWS